MISISLCMIVKDEEAVIRRCLESVKNIADEIIVVDTGSTDKTKEIVNEYTNKIYDFEWIDDFSAARNYSFSKATKEYVMWIDADDVILPYDQEEFLKLKKDIDSSVDTVMMKYNTAFDENGNATFTYYRERLFKKEINPVWLDPIHEVIVPSGNIIHSDISITHKKLYDEYSDRNLRIFEKMISLGKKLNPRQQFYYARELYYNFKYEEAIKEFNDFLDSKQGWIENCISACIDLYNTYNAIGDKENGFKALLRSFEYDEPRPEICCHIGNYFLQKGMYNASIFWYNTALNYKENATSGGFINYNFNGYIPCIQLCVCYYRIGDTKKAIEFNELAANFKPNDSAVEFNRNFFKNK
ncbi:MAG: tetratricopeptide repeat-containing glycosyltransferase family 2 protein [Peptostreptococcaceae bacterium]